MARMLAVFHDASPTERLVALCALETAGTITLGTLFAYVTRHHLDHVLYLGAPHVNIEANQVEGLRERLGVDARRLRDPSCSRSSTRSSTRSAACSSAARPPLARPRGGRVTPVDELIALGAFYGVDVDGVHRARHGPALERYAEWVLARDVFALVTLGEPRRSHRSGARPRPGSAAPPHAGRPRSPA